MKKSELRQIIREEIKLLNEIDDKVESAYKEYIKLVKAGKDYSGYWGGLSYFQRMLNKTYSTQKDREDVQRKLEKKYGENPKLKAFRK